MGSQAAEFGFQAFVAAVEQIDLVDDRFAFGHQTGENQCGTGTQIGGGDFCPLQAIYAAYQRPAAARCYARTSLHSSGTCCQRQANTLSVKELWPGARASNAMNWACKSVGKPG